MIWLKLLGIWASAAGLLFCVWRIFLAQWDRRAKHMQDFNSHEYRRNVLLFPGSKK